MGLLGVDWRGGRFRRFGLLAYEAITGAIDAQLAWKIVNAVRCVVGAHPGTIGAGIGHAFGAGHEIGAALIVKLGHGGTIEMGTGGESAANAKDYSKG